MQQFLLVCGQLAQKDPTVVYAMSGRQKVSKSKMNSSEARADTKAAASNRQAW
jgi:hypothetical protein